MARSGLNVFQQICEDAANTPYPCQGRRASPIPTPALPFEGEGEFAQVSE